MEPAAATNVRRALAADLPEIAQMTGEAQGMHASAYPNLFQELSMPDSRRWLEEVFDDKDHSLFVATRGNTVIGYMLLKTECRSDSAFQKAWSFLYLDQIDVREAARGSGAGKALLDFAKRYAKEQGFTELVLDVWGFNDKAKRFFEKEGFRPLMHRLTLDVAER